MLQMRLARPSDKPAVARVVDARCEWMEARGLPSWRSARDDLVTQCDNPEGDVWVLHDEVAGVIGQTVVQRQGPFGGTGKSGYGREMGFAAMAEYTTQKSVWINVDAALPDWYAQ